MKKIRVLFLSLILLVSFLPYGSSFGPVDFSGVPSPQVQINRLKIEKRSNGNVWITADTILVASVPGASALIPHRDNANLIVVGGSLSSKLYTYDFIIDVTKVDSTAVNGITTEFIGTRDDLIKLLGRDFFVDAPLQHAGLDLVAEEPLVTTNLAVAGDWYDVNGTFELSITPVGFEINGTTGNFTYIGSDDISFRFVGTSDVAVSKNAVLHYGLFINEEVEPRGVSVHTFSTPNAFAPMAITKYIDFNHGDELFIRAKSDVNSTILTPASLDTTFGGVK